MKAAHLITATLCGVALTTAPVAHAGDALAVTTGVALGVSAVGFGSLGVGAGALANGRFGMAAGVVAVGGLDLRPDLALALPEAIHPHQLISEFVRVVHLAQHQHRKTLKVVNWMIPRDMTVRP